jgi:hypothetical protein
MRSARIAAAQSRAGLTIEAAVTIGDALQIIRSLGDDTVFTDFDVVPMAGDQAEAGNFSKAMRVVQAITSEQTRARAIVAVARGQARAGDIAEALRTARLVAARDAAEALKIIGDAQMQAGRWREAATTWAKQRCCDLKGTWFTVDRAKTGRAALATLSRRAERVLDACLAQIGVELVGPIFRNRSGRPYNKDTLGDDFRDIRALVFGPSEARKLADFRRSGSVEALAGKVEPGTLSRWPTACRPATGCTKTYVPVQLALFVTPTPASSAGERVSENKNQPNVSGSRSKSIRTGPRGQLSH